MATHRVRICGRDYDAMADLVRQHDLDVFNATAKGLEEGGYCVDAHVDDDQIKDLRASGYRIQIQEKNVHRRDPQRRADIGQGNEYEPEEPN
jgi:hypothetical protein